MANENYLLMQKTSASVATSSATWGIVLMEMPMLDSHERKDAESNDWLDEHGDDMYFGSTIYFKAFDAEIKMGAKGTMGQIQEAYASLLSYLSTGGTQMMIYSEYVMKGRQNCSFSKISVPEYDATGDSSCPFVATWTLTMHVSDPVTDICCSQSGSNYVLSIL